MPIRKRIIYSIAFFPVAFMLLGIIFGLSWYFSRQTYAEATKITATVVDSRYESWYDADDNRQDGYKIYIRYTFEGQEYPCVYLYTTDNAKKAGTQIPIAIHPADPFDPLTEPSWIIPIIGGIFFVGGVVLGVKMFPHALVSEEEAKQREEKRKEKGSRPRFWALCITLVPALVFLLLTIYLSPFFCVGTLVFGFFAIVIAEM